MIIIVGMIIIIYLDILSYSEHKIEKEQTLIFILIMQSNNQMMK